MSVSNLRGRLLALIALLLTAGVALAGGAAYLVLREHLADRVDRTLSSSAERIEAVRRTEPVDLTPGRLEGVVPPLAAVALLDSEGDVLLSTTPPDAAPPVDGRADLTRLEPGEPVTLTAADGSRYRVVRSELQGAATVRIDDDTEPLTVDSVLLGVPLAGDEEALRTLLAVEIGGGATVVLLGTAGAAWLLGIGLRPLRTMSRAARRIEAGSDERIPEERPGSETAELAVALNAAFDARARAEARSRTFLADASHELRTPVTAVRAWADLYAAGALPETSDLDEAMASIGAEGERMRELVDQMLVLARLDAGVGLRAEPVDLRAVAQASVRSLRVIGADRLDAPAPGPPVPVAGDEEALRRVVDNLVVNALRHTAGPVQVRVDDRGEVEVRDHGPGLDAEQRERAFDRFWRGDEGRSRPGGSGLGLAIARDVARAHGGEVGLEEAGPGLRAVLRLPTLNEPSAGREAIGGPADRGPAGVSGGVGRVISLPLRHPRLTVLVWVLLVVGLVIGDRQLGGSFEDDIDLPGTQAAAGAELLDAHAADQTTFGGQVVLHDPDGVPDPAVTGFGERLSGIPGVVRVAEPVASDDGATTYLPIRLDESPRTLDEETLDALREAAAGVPAGVEVSWAGTLGEELEPSGGHRLPELIGLATALLVLLLVFGSLLAALVPLVTAAFAVAGGVALLGLLAAALTFGTTAPTLATMIGLGCGIDYALFLVTRARQHLVDGDDPATAARRALASSGHAVLVAAGTVAVALLGLYASGMTFVGQLGLASVVTLATAALSAVTLVPALLVLIGRRIDRWRVRPPVAESEGGGGRWAAYAGWVSRRPVAVLAGAVMVLGVLTVPLFSLQLGHVDDGADPAGSTTRVAYDRLEEGFGPGVNGTFTAVVELDGGTDPEAIRAELAEVEGVAAVPPFVPSSDGAIATSTITPTTDPQDEATADLVTQVNAAVPEVLLTGSTVAQIEFGQRVTDRLPVIIGLVVAASFVLLTLAFRSPVVALKAAVMNLVSIGASYGVLVAIFQWQWGSGLLGLDESVPVVAFVPMMMFAIVFGLSMDYEVFLLSRVRESWLRTGDAVGSVASGLAVTARVISAAALIMVSVFLSFALDDDVAVKMMAVGLAVSVAIDASIVRLLLVPSTMVLLGRANWWAPRWLAGRDRDAVPTP